MTGSEINEDMMRATRQLTPAQSVAWGKFVTLQLHSRTHSYAPGGSRSHGRCSRLQRRKSAANTFTDREIYNAQFFYLFIFFHVYRVYQSAIRTSCGHAQTVLGLKRSLAMTLALRLLALASNTFGLGRKDQWPRP